MNKKTSKNNKETICKDIEKDDNKMILSEMDLDKLNQLLSVVSQCYSILTDRMMEYKLRIEETRDINEKRVYLEGSRKNANEMSKISKDILSIKNKIVEKCLKMQLQD